MLLYSSNSRSKEQHRHVLELSKQAAAPIKRQNEREVLFVHRKSVLQKLVMKRQFSLACVKHHRQLCKGVPALCTELVKNASTVVVPSEDLMHLHGVCALCLVTLEFRSCHCVIC